MNLKSINICENLRYSVFFLFFLFSFRLVIVYLNYTPPWMFALGVILVLMTVILSCWQASWVLYGFIICVPLVSGLQVIAGDFHPFAFIKSTPVLSLSFAVIFMTWFAKRLFWDKKTISPKSKIGNLVDIISGIVELSIIVSFAPYPLSVVWLNIQSIPFLGQSDPFWFIQAGYILLQGLFFFRIMELELTEKYGSKKILSIFYIQVVIIIFFSVLQLFLKIPQKLPQMKLDLLYSPFNDIHSYGSYIVLLFLMVFCITFSKIKKYKMGLILLGFLLCFIFLSASGATFFAFIIIGSALLIYKFRSIYLVATIFLVLTFLIYFSSFLPVVGHSNNTILWRYAERVNVNSAVRVLKGRFLSADQALGILEAYPVTGSGIGSFYRISRYYHFTKRAHPERIENAHNYYLQFSAELGIIALILFLGIITYTYKLGLNALANSNNAQQFLTGLLFGLSAYLITMITGHPLILSNQQFLFWFVLAAITSLSLQSEKKRFFSKFTLPQKIIISVLVTSIMIGHAYNLTARDAGMPGFEYGLYEYENLEGKKMRWTKEEACMRVRADTNILGLTVSALLSNISPDYLVFNLFLNSSLLDKIHFVESSVKPLYYYIPSMKGKDVEVKTSVNRTYNPYKLGLSKELKKNREQGVALSPINFLKTMPKEGIGFYGWETSDSGEIPNWPENVPIKYRWTGMQASIPTNINNYGRSKKHISNKSNITLFLKCSHPNIGTAPVVVRIFNDKECIRKVTFINHKWKKVPIELELLKQSRALTFQVSRTWNPRLLAVSQDGRDLGVAVAILSE